MDYKRLVIFANLFCTVLLSGVVYTYYFVINKDTEEVYGVSIDIDVNADSVNVIPNEEIVVEDVVESFSDMEYYKEDNLERYDKYLEVNPTFSLFDVVSIVNVSGDSIPYVDVVSSDLDMGYLILVNKYNFLEDDYIPDDLVEIDDKYNAGYNNMLRSVANDAFADMCDCALLEGIVVKNSSAFRSYGVQSTIYEKYAKYDGFDEANTYVAKGGFSEHQTGLAVDVYMDDKDTFTSTNVYTWLLENSYKYGFILRYPKGKELITGYDFEPWHYRYVGVEVATYLQNVGITFDEYYSFNY